MVRVVCIQKRREGTAGSGGMENVGVACSTWSWQSQGVHVIAGLPLPRVAQRRHLVGQRVRYLICLPLACRHAPRLVKHRET